MDLKNTGCEDVNWINMVFGNEDDGNCEYGNEPLVPSISANTLTK
jgi:hypothetical protein